jgi:hypothetical protein
MKKILKKIRGLQNIPKLILGYMMFSFFLSLYGKTVLMIPFFILNNHLYMNTNSMISFEVCLNLLLVYWVFWGFNKSNKEVIEVNKEVEKNEKEEENNFISNSLKSFTKIDSK